MNKNHLILMVLIMIKTIFSQQLFPHIVWLYWNKGYNHLNGFEKMCISRVIQLHANTDWEVHFLDQCTIHQWLNKKNYQQLKEILNPKLDVTQQTRANFIRYYLLKQHGGVWLDVSIILFQNLNWLDHLRQNPKVIHKNIFEKPEIFVFYKHQGQNLQQKKVINYNGETMYPLINIQNSMIAAVKQSKFMNDLIEQYKILIKSTGEKYFYRQKQKYSFSYTYSSYFRAYLANNLVQYKKFSTYLEKTYKQGVSNIQNQFYEIWTMNRKYQMYHLTQSKQNIYFAFENQGSRGDFAHYFAKFSHFSTQQLLKKVFSGKKAKIQQSQKSINQINYSKGQKYLRPEYNCLYQLLVRQDSILNKYLLLNRNIVTRENYPNVQIIKNQNLPLVCKITTFRALREMVPNFIEWIRFIVILYIIIQLILQFFIFSFKSSQTFISYFQSKEKFKSKTFRVLILLTTIYLQKDLIYYQYQLWKQKSPTALLVGFYQALFTILMFFWISLESRKTKKLQLIQHKSKLQKGFYMLYNFQLYFFFLMLIQYYVQYSFTVWRYNGEIYNYEVLTVLNRQKLKQGEIHLMKTITLICIKIFAQFLQFAFRFQKTQIRNAEVDTMTQESNQVCGKQSDGYSKDVVSQQQLNHFIDEPMKKQIGQTNSYSCLKTKEDQMPTE